jgi:uncharacterized protein Yka (UPF0111/DUF47 family)
MLSPLRHSFKDHGCSFRVIRPQNAKRFTATPASNDDFLDTMKHLNIAKNPFDFDRIQVDYRDIINQARCEEELEDCKRRSSEILEHVLDPSNVQETVTAENQLFLALLTALHEGDPIENYFDWNNIVSVFTKQTEAVAQEEGGFQVSNICQDGDSLTSLSCVVMVKMFETTVKMRRMSLADNTIGVFTFFAALLKDPLNTARDQCTTVLSCMTDEQWQIFFTGVENSITASTYRQRWHRIMVEFLFNLDDRTNNGAAREVIQHVCTFDRLVKCLVGHPALFNANPQMIRQVTFLIAMISDFDQVCKSSMNALMLYQIETLMIITKPIKNNGKKVLPFESRLTIVKLGKILERMLVISPTGHDRMKILKSVWTHCNIVLQKIATKKTCMQNKEVFQAMLDLAYKLETVRPTFASFSNVLDGFNAYENIASLPADVVSGFVGAVATWLTDSNCEVSVETIQEMVDNLQTPIFRENFIDLSQRCSKIVDDLLQASCTIKKRSPALKLLHNAIVESEKKQRLTIDQVVQLFKRTQLRVGHSAEGSNFCAKLLMELPSAVSNTVSSKTLANSVNAYDLHMQRVAIFSKALDELLLSSVLYWRDTFPTEDMQRQSATQELASASTSEVLLAFKSVLTTFGELKVAIKNVDDQEWDNFRELFSEERANKLLTLMYWFLHGLAIRGYRFNPSFEDECNDVINFCCNSIWKNNCENGLTSFTWRPPEIVFTAFLERKSGRLASDCCSAVEFMLAAVKEVATSGLTLKANWFMIAGFIEKAAAEDRVFLFGQAKTPTHCELCQRKTLMLDTSESSVGIFSRCGHAYHMPCLARVTEACVAKGCGYNSV